MVLITGALTRVISEDGRIEDVIPEIHEIARKIADDTVPKKLSHIGNKKAEVLAMELLTNALHGERVAIEIEPHRDGTLDLTTSGYKGQDRLKSCYCPSVEAELPHQGTVLIKVIAGEGNYHTFEEPNGHVITHTRFDPTAILAAC